MSKTEKYIFEKLTPITDSNISVYESAINFAFEHDDVKNIAISGAYGAGKSSVLASYKDKHPNRKFMHISLAHFQNDQKAERFDTPVKDSILEGKILNQLIHQIPAEKIPQTNFRVKQSTGNKTIFFYTFAVALFLISLLHILFFNNWSRFVGVLPDGVIQHFLSISTSESFRLISGGSCFIISCFFFFQILLTQKNKSIFKKLSFQGNEIEIFEESDDSYFDKYLNEVLYLFENVEENVIVFEDMDRFDANRIFERLREINTLVNIQRKKNNKAILRFFYLLRDDIFISKDRTKFFDYIIPVIPVVDSSNSYNQFISHLNKNHLLSAFDEGFLQGISLYVDDMRLLKNICNEFLIYYNRLNTTELDCNKMFALITYKNLFPRDFSDLQLNRGFVYTLFDKKQDFIKKRRTAILTEIQKLEQRIQNAHSELAQSAQELTLIYDHKKARNGYYSYSLSPSDQEEYNRRLQAVNDRNNNNLQELEKKLTEYNNKLQKLDCESLSSIITRDNVDEVFSLVSTNEIGEEINFNEIKKSDYFSLVKYLIRNGYIDETYADYMTYFYENSLSRIDKTFLRSITDKKAKPYNYELKSPQMVFERLQLNDFDQEEALNFMLCDYLLSKEESSEHLAHLIVQIRDFKRYRFVAQYADSTAYTSLFVRIFNKHWPSLFVDMQCLDGFTSRQLKIFSVNTLYFSEPSTLDEVNISGALSTYINGAKDYLDIKSPDITKLITAFKQLNICFPQIDYDCSETGLLQAVYENNLYELNFQNIIMFLERVWQYTIDDIRYKNYTLISKDKESPLFKRIENNISDYVAIILQECNNRILDDEAIAISLLNRTDISAQHKDLYIHYLETPLHELSDLTDHTIWTQLLDSGVVSYSEKNTFDYFWEIQSFNSSLIDFVNAAPFLLRFSPKNITLTDEQRNILFDKAIICNELLDTQYSSILTSLDLYYDAFNVPGIQETKLKILISEHIIRMNPESLKYMRDEYPSAVLFFIKRNIGKYADIMNEDLFDQLELLEILSWGIPDSIKLSLLSFAENGISIIGKNYSLQVCAYILTNNLLQEDIIHLYLSYETLPTQIQEIVFEHAKKDVHEIILNPTTAAKLLKEKLLATSAISIEDRIALFAAIIPHIEQADTRKYLSMLGLDNFSKIFDSHSKPKFEITSQNQHILDAFKLKGWIYEYVEDESRPGYYKIRRRVPKKIENV